MENLNHCFITNYIIPNSVFCINMKVAWKLDLLVPSIVNVGSVGLIERRATASYPEPKLDENLSGEESNVKEAE